MGPFFWSVYPRSVISIDLEGSKPLLLLLLLLSPAENNVWTCMLKANMKLKLQVDKFDDYHQWLKSIIFSPLYNNKAVITVKLILSKASPQIHTKPANGKLGSRDQFRPYVVTLLRQVRSRYWIGLSDTIFVPWSRSRQLANRSCTNAHMNSRINPQQQIVPFSK